jgi:hypothetical protein
MNELRFERDIRSTEPDQTAHRQARFREGWRKGAAREQYGERSLRELTWDNLGYRLGVLFSETSSELMDELYDWCVRQQRERSQSQAP